jgi:hypothetical protein
VKTRAAVRESHRQATWSANRISVNTDALSFIRRARSRAVWFLPPTLTLPFMEAADRLPRETLLYCIVPEHFRGAGRDHVRTSDTDCTSRNDTGSMTGWMDGLVAAGVQLLAVEIRR